MNSSKEGAAGRTSNERLAEKIPAPIPESSVLPTNPTVDTESAVRNGTSDPALASAESQAVDGLTYSQAASRTLPGMVPLKLGCTIIH
jgi:hypothetical protein